MFNRRTYLMACGVVADGIEKGVEPPTIRHVFDLPKEGQLAHFLLLEYLKVAGDKS